MNSLIAQLKAEELIWWLDGKNQLASAINHLPVGNATAGSPLGTHHHVSHHCLLSYKQLFVALRTRCLLSICHTARSGKPSGTNR